ncbi:putative TWO-COMPONENT SENSOR PROTEIN HISTIDINE PROTEIN KINASE [Vibrio nigripulchritudo SOn1]|uniref:Sensory/regulatory protein RpfC n=1 Tax=Vibrio nigripulchritudo SOn1 TaxID=1238450 RepID=A0AAV2VU16_9VIBR|nr:hybrid sensor histidine kinase/response regulator [Vibrio nigripulchritudo]CCO48090.1 putative TWO-COMPONENT SENSOR PROTEIN HISTIDINE PROTEIN KINASE [Vibrio nigripulchritudo SOn1]
MKMKTLFSLLFLLMFVVNISIIFVANRTIDVFSEEEKILLQQSELIKMGNELKQSSDNLTKFARAYAVTGDTKWKQLFQRVLDVRNGKAPLPPGHEYDYWDVIATENNLQFSLEPGFVGDTFLQRINKAGMSETEVNNLALALSTSDQLVKLEEDAFKQIELATAQGRRNALDLLYGQTYFDEKAKIMAAIETAYLSSIDRLAVEHKNAANMVGTSSNLMLIGVLMLGFFLIISFLLLWSVYIAPLGRMQNQVISKVNDQDYDFTLSEKVKGDLGDFSSAINSLLFNLRNELRIGQTVQNYNDVIRGKEQLEEVISATKQFLSTHFSFPLITFYQNKSGDLVAIDNFGTLFDPTPDSHTFPYYCLESGAHLVVEAKKETPLKLAMGDMTVELLELHAFPIQANNKPLGVLQIGTVNKLTGNNLRILNELVENFSIAFQLGLNIEQQKETEQEVTRQLELNQHIIDSIPNPTYYRNRLGEYLGVNEQFCEFMELKVEDVLGNHIEDLFNEDTVHVLKRYELELLQGTKRLQFEMVLTNGKGEDRNLIVYEAPFYDQNNGIMGIVGTFMDVTETKRLERDLIESKESADKLSKIKGDFLANMSHEIRTPMNAIMGMTHLVLSSDLGEKQRDYVEKIDYSSKQLLGIINDILDFSKVEAGKLQIENTDFNLDKVLDNLASVLSVKAENKGIELIFNVSPNIPNQLIGDPLRLGQVLINLAGNAVKFTDSGEVIVTVSEESRNESSAVLKFSVEDTGIGMTPEQMSGLFQAFSQGDTSTTRKYGGTGLGLSISQQLIQLMGGEIMVSSYYGRGSHFWFELELDIGEERPTKERYLITQHKRALVIDDNDTARLIVASMLSDMMFEVDVASNASDAFHILDEAQKQYDLLLVDWQMPEMDGIQTIEHIRKHDLSPGSKMILITAYGNQLDFNDQYGHIIDGLVLKPINPSNLLDTIVDTLGSYISKEEIKEAAESPEVVHDISGTRILLVEDNITNQEIASTILENEGAQVSIANHGLEALEMLDSNTFDVVLMDMQMPVMDGLTATKEIRKIHDDKTLPVLAMTANAMREDVESCMNVGMNAHIAKPIHVPSLLAKISEFTQSRNGKESNAAPSSAERAGSIEMNGNSNKAANINGEHTFPEVEGIDLEGGLKRLSGNTEIYFSTLKRFFKSQESDLKELLAMIQDQELDQAKDKLHAIKGASANLSVDYIHQMSRFMEKQIKGGETPATDDVKKMMAFVEMVNSQIKETEEKPQDKIAIDSSFHKLLEQLNTALLEADTEALTIVEELQKYQLADSSPLNEMSELLDNFQFDQAADMLARLRQSI